MDIQGYLETVRLLPRDQASKCSQHNVQKDQQQGMSVGLVLVALGFMYSVHNLIAPNMTAIAKLFHMNNYERDAYIGGELTLFFYAPGVLGALFAGILSGMMERKILLAALACVTGLSCLCTATVSTFRGLAWARALTGFCIGGALPVVYSLVGDWFSARKRASATAFVSAASGAGVFFGQCIATVLGSLDWRWPFIIVMFPCVAIGLMIYFMAEEPVRGGQEDGVEKLSSMFKHNGIKYAPGLSSRHVRALLQNRTNLIVIIQAFPGNIPWGVIIVYMHDFLVQDLGLPTHSALGAITTLAASAFAGIFVGGFVGESLYGASSRYLAIFGGACNILRAVPFYVIFGWTHYFGPLQQSSETAFYGLLVAGGFVATMASPCTGAMLLNVNVPEMRGSVMALYSVLDDLAKGFGTFFIAMIVRIVGGRATAYQLSLLIWVFTGVGMLYTWWSYDDDERQMRKDLDEAAMESMVLASKHQAQRAVRDCAKAAGEAHLASRNHNNFHDRFQQPRQELRWPRCHNARRHDLHSGSSSATDCEGGLGLATGAGTKEDSTSDCVASPAGQAASGASSGANGNARLGWWRGSEFPGRATNRHWEDRDRVRRAAQAAAEAMAAGRKR